MCYKDVNLISNVPSVQEVVFHFIYFIKWVTTSWTYSNTCENSIFTRGPEFFGAQNAWIILPAEMGFWDPLVVKRALGI